MCKFSVVELHKMLPKALELVVKVLDYEYDESNDFDPVAAKETVWECRIKDTNPDVHFFQSDCEAILEVACQGGAWEVAVLDDGSLEIVD